MAADENAAARPSLADHIREGAARAGGTGEGRPLTLEEGVRSVRSEEYAPVRLELGETYRVNHIGAPVFGPDGDVTLGLFLIGFTGGMPAERVPEYAARLLATCERVTKGIQGRAPEPT